MATPQPPYRPMYQPRPQRTLTPGVIVLIITVVLLTLVGAVTVVSLIVRPDRPVATSAPATRPATSNDVTTDFTIWLGDRYTTAPAWAADITRVRTDVGAWDATVDTVLSDQVSSLAVCQQVGGFMLDRSGRQPNVQVLDSVGQVLASRHTGGQCEWRR